MRSQWKQTSYVKEKQLNRPISDTAADRESTKNCPSHIQRLIKHLVNHALLSLEQLLCMGVECGSLLSVKQIRSVSKQNS